PGRGRWSARALEAVSRGERFIELEDGSQGLLPAAWTETYDSLSKLAHDSSEEGLRFLPSQALIVDTLLKTMPPAVDKPFAEMREKLRDLDSIKPKKELAAFNGELRGYQRQGLGWLGFLREFGLGGVLADDMGLGKTVQVLAQILAYRTPKKTTKLPFLVVAPRSLIFNWGDEAAAFVPKLKVLEYSGADRESLRASLPSYDLVVTTYGTLRRDIDYLATVEFDTVILDEAQAIKNRDSQSAKASRLLNAQHRLALTGTPIENHLGELGSIFEFLNPGLFGRLPRLEALVSGRTPSEKELEMVSQGLRPFILRRTKAEVLPDLPPKTEQTLHCTLHPEQRELYDQLRRHYQASLLEQVESQGMSGSSFQVLEALLRLRQVACHPGLVKEEWGDAGSIKLDALFSHVSEVLEEGHKVVVFSQFTKLLAYVRRELDGRGTDYAYLDGSTKNRGEVVERFQTDPDCNLFLISIKAGGVGLNLTAAGYAFLLDPWWNPAVEAQAIDRVHRIGQTQPVFAYRLIARDTVEEKILELQRSKRQLADAILEADGRPLSDLTADDLRMLLS
ncbi:MAG: DEAD/DEAH box helicase, partial [Acidobacteriota bacterium]